MYTLMCHKPKDKDTLKLFVNNKDVKDKPIKYIKSVGMTIIKIFKKVIQVSWKKNVRTDIIDTISTKRRIG